jgi:cell division protein ZapE
MSEEGAANAGPINAAYQAALLRRGYQADAAQLAAVDRLNQLAMEFADYKQQRSNAFKRLIHRPEVPRGIWLWGGVGRGKSFIMDTFYDNVDVRRKQRVHFHEFMRSIHHELESLKGQADPLDAVAERVASRARLICFDEFHISDIADAMILERLLRSLFKRGLCLVSTSNYEPDLLYPDGLHRDRILPAIDLLKEHQDIVRVDAGQDYRRRALSKAKVYFPELNAQTDKALRSLFDSLAERADQNPVITIEHRQISSLRRAGGVIWFDFATLCGGPRSQNDYLEIAKQFHTLVLSGVPMMSVAMSSEARRFTWLVDILYDQKVKLIVGAQGEAETLYKSGMLANEFQRTVSRLIEMQTDEYLATPKRIGAG